MKKILKSKKGFTLAELLIVVAIIGVLVAISVPIFTSQLEKAREGTDEANIRSAYSELAADVLTGDAIEEKTNGNITINKADADDATVTATVQLTQTKNDWQNSVTNIGGMTQSGSPKAKGKATITITRESGAATLSYSAK